MSIESLRKKLFLAAGAASLALTAACNTPVGDAADYDPWEPMNRSLYQASYVIDGVLLKPVTQIYRGVIPEYGQERVHNFVENLASPITIANSLLQGDPENTFISLWRFLFNSTIGIGGLFDVASELGLHGRTTDFGQTLALYGVENGPYLFLPIMGPSGVRDGVGRIADYFAHPAAYVDDTATSVSLWAVTAVDARNQNYDLIEDIYKTSLDPYATFRSGYIQKRDSDIRKARASRDAVWKRMKEQK